MEKQKNNSTELSLNAPELRFPEFIGDWEKRKLGELAFVTMGQSPDSKFYNTEEIGIPLIQGNADITNRISNPRNWTSEPTKECKKGDLILTVRAPVGAVAKSIHHACIGRGVCSIKNNTKSNQEFLFQILLDYELKWKRLEQGSTFTAVNGSDIKSIVIPFPTLPEQQKIASFLTVVDDKLQALKKKKVLLEQYKKGVMQKIFPSASSGNSPEIRFKDAFDSAAFDSAQASDSSLIERSRNQQKTEETSLIERSRNQQAKNFPEWKKKKLGQIFTEINEAIGTRNIETYSISAGKGFVSQKEKFGKDISGQQNEKYIVVNPDQFSYNKGNSKTYTYGCVYLNNTGKTIAVPNVFISFKLTDSRMSSNYFAKLFEHHYLDKGLRRIISSTARMDGLLNVNKNYFFDLIIPVPPINEQIKIGEFLSAIDEKINHCQKQIEATEQWKKGLLQKMFV